MNLTTDQRFLASGDEAGTAPGDRKFRPDVQGLRAVAILLVVLFHAGVPGVSGGYVGVDVFFVISGFVITGVLLREHASNGGTSILAFYGRRARRIIPAATLVIIATVLATYVFVGSVTGSDTAVDGQWASVFLANFHFAAEQTNYLASLKQPSPLQNYWSLAVEEQFYIVYPTIFLIVAGLFTRSSLRIRIGIVLGLTVLGSYALSVVLTSTNASSAFFSPFTRAWELALGGLVAVSSDSLRRLSTPIAAGISWLGLGGILVAAFVFTSATAYPGSLVALPVIGAALIIIGGAAQPRLGVEFVLRRKPLQLLGLISYSWYLWHWPILMIATQSQNRTSLPVPENIFWVLVALVLGIGTYFVVENPIRHSRLLISRRWASVAMGSCLIISSLALTTFAVRPQQPISFGIVNGEPGTRCPSPSKKEIASLRSTYESKRSPSARQNISQHFRMLVIGDSTGCTQLPGLWAVGPSYGVQVENATVFACGVVSGQYAPVYYDGVDMLHFSEKCQKTVNKVEASVIRRYKPNLILWSSMSEKGPIVVDTGAGSRILSSGSAQWKTVLLQRMDARVQQFIAGGATVLLELQPPLVDLGKPTRPTQSDEQFAQMNALLLKVAALHPGHVGVINLASRVCPSGPPVQLLCPVYGCGRITFTTFLPLRFGSLNGLCQESWPLPDTLYRLHTH